MERFGWVQDYMFDLIVLVFGGIAWTWLLWPLGEKTVNKIRGK